MKPNVCIAPKDLLIKHISEQALKNYIEFFRTPKYRSCHLYLQVADRITGSSFHLPPPPPQLTLYIGLVWKSVHENKGKLYVIRALFLGLRVVSLKKYKKY
jgi:hypothetical protein